MRYRFCFVSNSSSSSFILKNYLPKISDDEDIVLETSDQSNEEDGWDEIEKRFEQEREECLQFVSEDEEFVDYAIESGVEK